MRRFFIKCFALMLLLAAGFAAANYLSSIYYIKKRTPELSKKRNILIIGNSRPECALDDKVIDSSVNLCRSGESYFYLKPKVSCILEKNRQFDFAIIQFSPSEISADYESIWEDKYVYEFLPKYLSKLGGSGFFLLMQKNPKAFFHCMSGLSILKNLEFCGFGKINCNSSWGGFRSLDRNIDTLKQKKELKILNDFKSYNLQSLIEIISLLKRNNVTPVFIACPVLHHHADLLEFEKIRMKHFPDILYLNFYHASLGVEFFGDPEHLNKKGAERFSLFVDSLFKKGVHLNPKDFADKANSINFENLNCSFI